MFQTSISFRPTGFVMCAWVTQVDFLLCIRKRAWNLSNSFVVWNGLLKTMSVKREWLYLTCSGTLCELVKHCVSLGISAALGAELAISTCTSKKKKINSGCFALRSQKAGYHMSSWSWTLLTSQTGRLHWGCLREWVLDCADAWLVLRSLFWKALIGRGQNIGYFVDIAPVEQRRWRSAGVPAQAPALAPVLAVFSYKHRQSCSVKRGQCSSLDCNSKALFSLHHNDVSHH